MHSSLTGKLKAQPLWLVWVGIQIPPLHEIWQLYLRRLAIEHWYRECETNLALDNSEAERSANSLNDGVI